MRLISLLSSFVLAALSHLKPTSGGRLGNGDWHASVHKVDAVVHHRRLGCNPAELPVFDPSVTPETLVSFVAMGDTPYSIEDRYCLNHQLRGLDLVSANGPSFVIHVGDIRNGIKSDPCNAEAYK